MRFQPAPASKDAAPIPERAPPLEWRRPAQLWTPLALVLALGWPAAALRGNGALPYFYLVAGAAGFALAFVSLAGASIMRRPPKTRRIVITHVIAGCAAALAAAPTVYLALLRRIAALEDGAPDVGVGDGTGVALAPLALMLGLPAALFAGAVFSLVSFAKAPPAWARKHAFVPDVYVVTERAPAAKP